ncbi:hypothetical protein D3H55_10975 [Bacillus salacetis]|uniref:Uncharacterized protein n=1 Tax=Bacillus salacetis TaxID=2315464 RepID=A0A3A1QYB8_9BACI|nr:hypothetical protein [Bacillus salacetis]RIW33600.1 hypothetical protein D3H55_10975 [Bacillus salacetis]
MAVFGLGRSFLISPVSSYVAAKAVFAYIVAFGKSQMPDFPLYSKVLLSKKNEQLCSFLLTGDFYGD